MRPGRDQVGHGRARVGAGDQALSHQDGIGTGVGVHKEVVRPTDPALGHGHDLGRQVGQHGLERPGVDLQRVQVAGVHPDQAGPGVDRALGLGHVVHLDERGQPEGLGTLDERDEGRLLERGDDEQHEVGTGLARLPQLVAGDDEVLAQHR